MAANIYLRALEIDDYKVSINWRKDQEVWNMLGGPKYYVSEAYERKWVENAISDTKDIKLAICLIKNDLYIGNVYITELNYINRSCHSHILIGNKEHWGKGYGKEAIYQLLDFVFNERGLNRVEAKVLEDNLASIKMFEGCGYKVEGTLRQSIYKNGRFKNQVLLSILKDDYQPQPK